MIVTGTLQGLERISLSYTFSHSWVGGWTFLFSGRSLSAEDADQLLI